LSSVNSSTFIVRPVGGTALSGTYSGQQGVVNFWPSAALAANTTYEVVISGIKDFAGNPITTAFHSTFSTGAAINSAPSGCTIGSDKPALVGASVTFTVSGCSGSGNTYAWTFGDGNG